MTLHPTRVLLVPILALLVAACTSGAAAPPAGSPARSPISISTPDEAAALVIASDPRFRGIHKLDANMIGQCCSYLAEAQPNGMYGVTIEVGWGDCPAGCISRHHWFYTVTQAGVVSLGSEDGPPVPAGTTGGGILPGGPGIDGVATAGPTCPVVKPNDPSCNDRPVAGATIVILSAAGSEVARLKTDTAGHFQATLPAGSYRIAAQPVDGLMRTPDAIDVTVATGFTPVQLAYDTGIR